MSQENVEVMKAAFEASRVVLPRCRAAGWTCASRARPAARRSPTMRGPGWPGRGSSGRSRMRSVKVSTWRWRACPRTSRSSPSRVSKWSPMCKRAMRSPS